MLVNIRKALIILDWLYTYSNEDAYCNGVDCQSIINDAKIDTNEFFIILSYLEKLHYISSHVVFNGKEVWCQICSKGKNLI
ncbi:hypothetical protein [Caproiciproducens sp.]